jgi:hypothetical protein
MRRCTDCRRPALFRSRGKKARRKLHSDDQHDLCSRCYKSRRDSAVNKRIPARQPRDPLVAVGLRPDDDTLDSVDFFEEKEVLAALLTEPRIWASLNASIITQETSGAR